MKFDVRVTDSARRDADEAADWYERQALGLGDSFTEQFHLAAAALATSAQHHSFRFGDVRCAKLKRFSSYGLFYVISGQEVVIFAVTHQARDPRRLRERRTSLEE
jgi:plasmid stabilization system protein ParE